MQLIRGLQQWSETTDTVVTIGNFDGAHRGHQAMFAALRKAADAHHLPATVVSFEPLPHEYFASQTAPERLQGLRDRVSSIKNAGMDRLLLLDFNDALAARSAESFIDDVLVARLRAKHLVIGDDFQFGHQRKGNYALLQTRKQHYSLQQSQTCLHDGKRVSSTRIREHLRLGQLDQAAELLGRPYRISGRVVHGEKMGRQLGFPTANVFLGKHHPPLSGVFAVWAEDIATAERYPAVANLGERPTVGGRKLLLEVHLLDQNIDLYGHHLAVDFEALIRPEQRFASLNELKEQIARDADTARKLTACR